MKLFLVLLFLAPQDVFAQKHIPPRFEDYPISVRFEGNPTPVNLRSHAQAGRFRTRLRNGIRGGASFAGSYAVTYWGCGTECIRIGIVDLKIGRAHVAPFFTSFGISYRIGSWLFVVEPPETLQEVFGTQVPQEIQSRYYLWTGNRLVLLHPNKEKNGAVEDYWK